MKNVMKKTSLKEDQLWLFVLGLDWQACLLELDFLLRHYATTNPNKVVDFSANAAVVDFAEDIFRPEVMYFQAQLGGIQKIARVYGFIPRDVFFTAFPMTLDDHSSMQFARREITRLLGKILRRIFKPVKAQKFFVASSYYPEFFDDEHYQTTLKYVLPFLNDTIVEQFQKRLDANATYYSYPQEYIDAGTLNPIFPHHVLRYELLAPERAELIFALTEEGCYVARTFSVSDPNFFKKVDEERPVTHYRASVPPKVARMMLTFGIATPEGVRTRRVLDPFCGTGTFLLMARYLGHSVYGMDISADMVESTRKNLAWYAREFEGRPLDLKARRLTRGSVDRLTDFFKSNFFDVVVTEPILLPYYREPPLARDLKDEFADRLRPKYQVALAQIAQVLKPGGRCVIVTPYVRSADGQTFRLNLEPLAESASPRLVLVPPVDTNRIAEKSHRALQFLDSYTRSALIFHKHDVVNREIWIFERPEKTEATGSPEHN